MTDKAPEGQSCRVDVRDVAERAAEIKIAKLIAKKPIIAKALEKLKTSALIKELDYHNFGHTDDVFHEAIFLVMANRQLGVNDLSEREIELLAIAAVYHDMGFAEQYEGNEKKGAEAAREAMAKIRGYTEEEIKTVEQAILDTTLRVGPGGAEGWFPTAGNKISAYLLDADVANFGREDFLDNMRDVFAELIRKIGWERINLKDFYGRTQERLNAHKWHTQAAKRLWEEGKQKNLRILSLPALKPEAYSPSSSSLLLQVGNAKKSAIIS